MMKPRPRSPFRPTFGVTPPEVAGRAATIDAVLDALDEGPGASARISLVTGTRGIGKTILLNAVEDEAWRRGWVVISETMSPGLLSRLADEHVPQAWRSVRADVDPDPADPRQRRRVSGLTAPAGLGGVAFSVADAEPLLGLRANLGALARRLEARGSGLMVTIDEVHRSSSSVREDFQSLAATVQHLWREEQSVALVMAGLPAAVQDLLTNEVITFLRRAERFTLGLLSPDDVDDALRTPVEQAGRTITDDAVASAVDLAQGYPYLVQVVGDLAWRREPDAQEITRTHVEAIADRAIRTLGVQVHQPAVADLSPRDRDFLVAMLPDPGGTAVSDLLARLDVDHGYSSRYRQRLILSGVVVPDGRGRLRYALPYLRDYLLTLER